MACRRRLAANLQPGKLLAAWQELQNPSVSEAQLEALTTAEQEAREEAELTLLQLHQVQEELEHYFLLSRGQSQQLERYNQLQRRSQRLLAKATNQKLAGTKDT